MATFSDFLAKGARTAYAKLAKLFFIYFLLFGYFISYCLLPLAAQAALATSSQESLPLRDYAALASDKSDGQANIYITSGIETFLAIAQKFNISLSMLLAYNKGLSNRADFNATNALPKGSAIVIPRFDPPKLNDNSAKTPGAEQETSPLSDSISSQLAKDLLSGAKLNDAIKSVPQGAANYGLKQAVRSIEGWANQYATLRAGLAFGADLRPSIANLDILLPFYENNHLLLFAQSSVNYRHLKGAKDKTSQLNIGIGNRYFAPHFMWGLNGFLDYDAQFKAARLSAGLELWHDYLRLAANSYFAVTGWSRRDIAIGDKFYNVKPANGFDIRLKSYLPFYPQIAFMGSYERYFAKEADLLGNNILRPNPYGLTFGVNYQPLALLNVDLAYKMGPKLAAFEFGVKLAYHIGVPLMAQLAADKIADLRKLAGARYSFVERNNNIILAYKREVPVILRDVSGLAGDEKSLIAKAELNGNWQIKAWHNPAQLALSKECYSEKDLASCRVTLPAYKRHSKNNSYQVILSLIHKASGKEQNYTSHIRVAGGKVSDQFSVIFNELSALAEAGQKRLSLFKQAELGSSWRIADWQITAKQSDIPTLTPRNVLNEDCWQSSQLASCRLTLPNNDSAVSAQYVIRAVFVNDESQKERALEAHFQILPDKTIFALNSPIEAEEQKPVKLFREIELDESWSSIKWDLPEQFTARGGRLSDACYERDKIAQCEVILPRYYSTAHEKGGSSYKIALQLATLDKHMRRDSWDIKVKPLHAQAQMAVKVRDSGLAYGQAIPVTIALEEGGIPIDIAERDLNRYFTLELSKIEEPSRLSFAQDGINHDKKARRAPALSPAEGFSRAASHGKSSSYLGELKVKAPGLFEVMLHAGEDEEKVRLHISYSDIVIDSRMFLISAKEHFSHSAITLERPHALLASLGGKPLSVAYHAVNGAKTVAKDKLRLKILDKEGNPAPNVATIQYLASDGASFSAQLSAQKIGSYYIGLYYQKPNATEQLLSTKEVHFIDGRPSQFSKLYFDSEEIALDNSAGLPDRAQLTFEAYDEYGDKLNYDELGADANLALKTKLIFAKQANEANANRALDFTYQGKNILSWQARAHDIVKNIARSQWQERYQVQAIYEAIRIGPPAGIKIALNKTVPDQVVVTPGSQRIDLTDEHNAYIDYNFSKAGFAVAAPAAPISFKLFKLADHSHEDEQQEGVLSDIKPVVSVKADKTNHIALRFTETGLYRLTAYYKNFAVNGGEIEIKGSSAYIHVHAQRFAEERHSSVKAEPQLLTAKGDLSADKALSTKICFLAIGHDNKPISHLTDVKAIISRDKSEVTQLALGADSSRAGLYCGQFKITDADGKWRRAGNYDVSIYAQGRIVKDIHSHFTIDLRNLAPLAIGRLASSVAILASEGGLAQTLAYEVVSKGGYNWPAERIKFALKKKSNGELATQAAEFSNQTSFGKGVLSFTAKERGDYVLSLMTQDYEGNWHDSLNYDVHFAQGIPDNTKLNFNLSRDLIAPDDRGGFPAELRANMVAFDPYGYPLNYEKLVGREHINKWLKLKLRYYEPSQGRNVQFNKDFNVELSHDNSQCPAGNCYSWLIKGIDIYPEQGTVKDFEASLSYADFELGGKKRFRVDHDYTLPTSVEVTHKKTDIVYVHYKDFGPEYRFYWHKRPYDYNSRQKIFYELAVIKNNTLQSSQLLAGDNLKRESDRDILTRKIEERGDYRFRAYLRSPRDGTSLIYIPDSEAVLHAKGGDYENDYIDHHEHNYFPYYHPVGERQRLSFWAKYKEDKLPLDDNYLKVEIYKNGYRLLDGSVTAFVKKDGNWAEVFVDARVPTNYEVVVFYKERRNRQVTGRWHSLFLQKTISR